MSGTGGATTRPSDPHNAACEYTVSSVGGIPPDRAGRRGVDRVGVVAERLPARYSRDCSEDCKAYARMLQGRSKAESARLTRRFQIAAGAVGVLAVAMAVLGFPGLRPDEPPTPTITPPAKPTSSTLLVALDAAGTAERLGQIGNVPKPPPPKTADTETPTQPVKPPEPEMPAKFAGVANLGGSLLAMLTVDGKQHWVAEGETVPRKNAADPAVTLVSFDAGSAMVKVGDAEPKKLELSARASGAVSVTGGAPAPALAGKAAPVTAERARTRADRLRAMRDRARASRPDAARPPTEATEEK